MAQLMKPRLTKEKSYFTIPNVRDVAVDYLTSTVETMEIINRVGVALSDQQVKANLRIKPVFPFFIRVKATR